MSVLNFPTHQLQRSTFVLLRKLTADESKILRLLYGIDCAQLSRAEVAQIFDKDIDAIEETALRKLRSSSEVTCG